MGIRTSLRFHCTRQIKDKSTGRTKREKRKEGGVTSRRKVRPGNISRRGRTKRDTMPRAGSILLGREDHGREDEAEVT